MGVAVLAEDGAAVLGVGIAGMCIGASHLTEDPRWDGVGSLAIGCKFFFFFFGVYFVYFRSM